MFTDEELITHQDEMDLIEGLSCVMHQLQSEAGIPLGGMVRREDYRRLQELNDQFKRSFIDLEENDRQKELHSNVWPYQDT
jgi:hypothetical protein